MNNTYKTEAIVLKGRDLSEKDKIITFLSPTLGKFDAVSKGVKKITGKTIGKMEPMNRLYLFVSRGKNLDTISQEHLSFGYPKIRQSLSRTASALYMLDTINRRTEKDEENIELYKLLKDSLYMLEKGINESVVTRIFDIKLVSLMGYQPFIDGCILCRRAGDFDYFSFERCGTVCPICKSQKTAESGMPVSIRAIRAVRFLMSSNPVTASKYQADDTILNEIKTLFANYMLCNLPGQAVNARNYTKIME